MVILVGTGVVLFGVVVVVGWGGSGIGKLSHHSCSELLSCFLVESFTAGCLTHVGQAVIIPQLLEHQAIAEDLVKEHVVTVAVNGKWGEELGWMRTRQRSGGVDWLNHSAFLSSFFAL
jgi:hypothetical protein